MSTHKFPEGITALIGWYVYRLVDPRNGETFYVGKGHGNRIFRHVNGDVDQEIDALLPLKIEIIKEIHDARLEVTHIIHRYGIPDEHTAYLIEAVLIDAYPNLSNIVGGHDSSELGCTNVDALIEYLNVEEAVFAHDVILIDVGKSFSWKTPTRDSLYDAVRLMWVLNLSKAKKYELVLPHRGGIIIGVFRPQKWMKVTSENFPEFSHNINHLASERASRSIGFIGREESDADILTRYVRKRIPQEYRTGRQNPCRYVDLR